MSDDLDARLRELHKDARTLQDYVEQALRQYESKNLQALAGTLAAADSPLEHIRNDLLGLLAALHAQGYAPTG